jgi:basic amino acid/polyamine antiporter, APA family
MSNARGHPEAPASPDLVRGLGLWQATAIVVSTMVGTGVFLVAAPMARAAGSANLVLISWLAGLLIVLCAGLCFAELGAALPQAGGLFVYLSRGLGPFWGFLFGWTNSVLAAPARMATLAAGFMRFVGYFVPGLGVPWLTFHIAHHAFTLTAAQPLGAGVVLSLTAFNYLSVRIGGAFQLVLCAIKVAVLSILIAGGLRLAGAGAAAPMPASSSLAAIPAALSALVPVMWAYNGFHSLGYLGGEVRNAGANLPRALLGGVLLVGALYILVDITYFHVLPLRRIALSQDVASDVAASLFGAGGARWLTIAMAVSALATLHAVIMAEARVPYAMARRGLFFFFAAARVHSRFRSPIGALLYIGTLAALLTLSGTFEELYSIYVFTMWIFFGMAAVALIRLRVREPGLERPYRAWGYPLTPLAFSAAALALTVNLWIESPVRSSLDLLAILAGAPVYRMWRARQRERASDSGAGAPPAEQAGS